MKKILFTGLSTKTMTQPYKHHLNRCYDNHHHRHHATTVCKIIFTTVILLANIFLPCQCYHNNGQLSSSTPSAAKFSVHMVRSPESAVAPVKDEVLFECELNVKPDQLRWRFRPQSIKSTVNNYIYLKKNVMKFKLFLKWIEEMNLYNFCFVV